MKTPKRPESAIALHHGDCREVLAGLPADSVEACVTDPPYHLTSEVPHLRRGRYAGERSENERAARAGFMGKTWDGGDIAQDPAMWTLVARVLKPGAHLAAFGGTRTYHRMMCAIEDAGFEIRDTLMWVYGSGFPKSHNIAVAIAKRINPDWQTGDPYPEEALAWDGFGTALKPAWEPIVLARKPFAGTVAANVAKHGTGALNIAGCRVESDESTRRKINSDVGMMGSQAQRDSGYRPNFHKQNEVIEGGSDAGRWPANVCHDGSPEVLAAFAAFGERKNSGYVNPSPRAASPGYSGFAGAGTPFCYGDTGTAARFYYTAKASREERGAGNGHPTVKPLALMQWLCRLVTPPGGTVLDPFCGSGSTLVAADREGFHGIGIEMDAEYVEIARRRVHGDCPLFVEVA